MLLLLLLMMMIMTTTVATMQVTLMAHGGSRHITKLRQQAAAHNVATSHNVEIAAAAAA